MFVALDLSLTAIGWARTNASGSSPEVGTLKPAGRGVARLQDALNQVVHLLRDSSPQLVLLEGYAFANPRGAHQLGELGGVVRIGLHQSRALWVEVPPKVVKKLATGSGNAKKQNVLATAIRELGYEGSSFDEADARWLLEAARIYYDIPGAARVARPRRGYFDTVSWPRLRSMT